MFRPTGNLLTDLFGTEDFVIKSNQFKEFLKQKNQIPFVHFDGENDFEKASKATLRFVPKLLTSETMTVATDQ